VPRLRTLATTTSGDGVNVMVISQKTGARQFGSCSAMILRSDEIMRMHAETAVVGNGHVHLPKDARWLPLAVFPKPSTTTKPIRPHKCSTASKQAGPR